jgi:hypothetical protein
MKIRYAFVGLIGLAQDEIYWKSFCEYGNKLSNSVKRGKRGNCDEDTESSRVGWEHIASHSLPTVLSPSSPLSCMPARVKCSPIRYHVITTTSICLKRMAVGTLAGEAWNLEKGAEKVDTLDLFPSLPYSLLYRNEK